MNSLRVQSKAMLPKPKKNHYVFYLFRYNDWYKIGTSLTIYKRMMAHDMNIPGDKELLMCQYCNSGIERVIINKFKDNQCWGREWFKLNDSDITVVKELVDSTPRSRYNVFGSLPNEKHKKEMELIKRRLNPDKYKMVHDDTFNSK